MQYYDVNSTNSEEQVGGSATPDCDECKHADTEAARHSGGGFSGRWDASVTITSMA